MAVASSTRVATQRASDSSSCRAACGRRAACTPPHRSLPDALPPWRARARARARAHGRVCLTVMCGGGQDADGKPLRLYSEEFSKQFLYPSYPKNNAAYGCACITQAIAVSCGPFSGSGAARSAQPKYYCFILCSDRQQKHFIGSELMGVGTSLIPY